MSIQNRLFKTDWPLVLNAIRERTLQMDDSKVRRILVYVSVREFGIGDGVVYFTRVRAISSYFGGIKFDLLTNDDHYRLMKGYPLADRIFLDMEDVDFRDYDLVITFSNQDLLLAGHLQQRYGRPILDNRIGLAVCSLFGEEEGEEEQIFPEHPKLKEYISGYYRDRSSVVQHEIYPSNQEVESARLFFDRQGIEKNANIIVLIDSTSDRQKLMGIDCFEKLLRHFLGWPDTYVMIYNPEKGFDKPAVYRELIGPELLDRIIFIRNSTLRNDFCLLTDDRVKMMIGPCTGLMHCAEAVFNGLEMSGRLTAERPVLITYIGPPLPGDLTDKWFWWGHTHVHACYIEKNAGGKKKVYRLESRGKQGLHCSEFAAEPLLEYIYENFGKRIDRWKVGKAGGVLQEA